MTQARLWLFSDLHQEHADNAWSPVAPADGFDIVVAAGDVAQQLPDALAWLHDRFPGVPTIYVPGNHDFWCDAGQPGGRPWTDILAHGRDLAARWGITLLSDDAAVIDGVRFLGSTLWTDFRVGQPSLQAGFHAATRGFNDCRRVRRPSSSGKTRKMQPADFYRLHRASVDSLDADLGIAHDGPTVVVTHHAPHPDALGLRPRDGLDCCYASDLTWLIDRHQPTLWVHGHVHGRLDTRVSNTRIVANARGHVGDEDSAQAFDPALIVRVS